MMKNFLIEPFVALGNYLTSLENKEEIDCISRLATSENPWFTQKDIQRAFKAIIEEFLQEDKLSDWIKSYEQESINPKNVLLIMAGNIPMVGFYDLLCSVVCRNRVFVKYSSKDRVLMEYIVKLLKILSSEVVIDEYDCNAEIDKVISMGSSTATLSFENSYRHTPKLLRSSRHSIAILDGTETPEEIESLKTDMFSYSGLGCRNVSLIVAPNGFDPSQLKTDKFPSESYRNNYRYEKALRVMRCEEVVDLGCCLICMDRLGFSSSISCFNLYTYDSILYVEEWIKSHQEQIQCIVGHGYIPFGRSQYPSLKDVPDGEDVIEFLLK